MPHKSQLKMVDLFAGIGGFSLAFSQAGIEPLYATDNDEKCQVTYQRNFNHPFILKDITRKTTENYTSVMDDLLHLQFDILTAGFPCQSFSKAGAKQGFYDPRGKGELFFHLLEILKWRRTQWVVLENVPHLQRHQHGQTFGTMMEQLTSLGYFFKFAILNSRQYTALPQNRDRLYVVATQKKPQIEQFSWPEIVSQKIPLADLLEQKVAERYIITNSNLWQRLKHHQFKPDEIYLWRRDHLRVYESQICPTLLASMGTGGYNVPLIWTSQGLRQLTERECARLLGFPDEFVLPSTLASKYLYQQLGNSVSLPVVEALAKKIASIHS